jgi:hypothetical protein
MNRFQEWHLFLWGLLLYVANVRINLFEVEHQWVTISFPWAVMTMISLSCFTLRFTLRWLNSCLVCANHFAFATRNPAKLSPDDRDIVIDSGSSAPMFKSEKYFIGGTLRPHVVKVEVATGVIVWSVAIGTVMIPVLVNGQTQWRKIENALYVPNLHHNLLSVGYLASEGYTTVLPRRSAVLSKFGMTTSFF